MDFKSVHIVGTTLEDTWFQLLFSLMNNGRSTNIDEGSYKGSKRLEFDFVSGFINFPHMRPLSPTLPEGIPRPTTDDDIEKYFVNYLMDYNLSEGEHYRYSSWINKPIKSKHNVRDYYGMKLYYDLGPSLAQNSNQEGRKYSESQLDWCIRHFKEKGYSNNHCFIIVGDPDSNFVYDYKYTSEFDRRTSPCLRGIDLKIKDNKLILGVIFRSWDLYGGWPENMGGFTLLDEYIAEQLEGVEPGPIAFASMGLHCYDFQIEVVKTALRK